MYINIANFINMKRLYKNFILLTFFIFNMNLLLQANQVTDPSGTFSNQGKPITPSEIYAPTWDNPYSPGDQLKNEEPPVLFAPPEGGDPIGGLPVGDAFLFMAIAVTGYGIMIKYKKKSTANKL